MRQEQSEAQERLRIEEMKEETRAATSKWAYLCRIEADDSAIRQATTAADPAFQRLPEQRQMQTLDSVGIYVDPDDWMIGRRDKEEQQQQCTLRTMAPQRYRGERSAQPCLLRLNRRRRRP